MARIWSTAISAEPEPLQVLGDGRVELVRFGLLLAELRNEPRHLVLEWLAVVLLWLRADVAAGGEHMAVLADLFQCRRLAEAGDVFVCSGALFALPGLVGIGNAGDVFVGQLTVGAVHHAAHLAGIDEEDFVPSVAGNKPQAGGNLSGVESWPGSATMQSTRSASIRLFLI